MGETKCQGDLSSSYNSPLTLKLRVSWNSVERRLILWRLFWYVNIPLPFIKKYISLDFFTVPFKLLIHAIQNITHKNHKFLLPVHLLFKEQMTWKFKSALTSFPHFLLVLTSFLWITETFFLRNQLARNSSSVAKVNNI